MPKKHYVNVDSRGPLCATARMSDAQTRRFPYTPWKYPIYFRDKPPPLLIGCSGARGAGLGCWENALCQGVWTLCACHENNIILIYEWDIYDTNSSVLELQDLNCIIHSSRYQAHIRNSRKLENGLNWGVLGLLLRHCYAVTSELCNFLQIYITVNCHSFSW